MTGAELILIILLAAAFITDIRKSVIPNVLTLSGLSAGLTYHVILNGWEGLAYSLWGIFGSAVPFILLYTFSAVGAGDVKLFAAIGAIAGLEYTAYAMFYSILYAGVVGIMILAWRKQFMQRIIGPLIQWFIHKRSLYAHEHLRFPFMLAVIPGVLTAEILLA